MERQLMDGVMAVVDNFMRQDKETRRQVLELLKKHLNNFQADLDRLLRDGSTSKGLPDSEPEITEKDIREQFMLHELFKPPVADRGLDDDDDLFDVDGL